MGIKENISKRLRVLKWMHLNCLKAEIVSRRISIKVCI